MSKVKILSLLSIGLLLSNLLLIGFIVLQKPMYGGPNGPRSLILERLKFDKGQIEKYDVLIDGHRKKIQHTELEIKGLKNTLYESLARDSNNLYKDSIINAIGQCQIKIESIHYKHFQDVKKLCNENQLPAFNALTEELASLFSRRPRTINPR